MLETLGNTDMKTIIKAFIRIYTLCVSPFTGPRCRYHPTCSAYAMEAIDVHGPWKGSWLGIKRVLRCHPLSKHDPIDPVPPSQAE